MGRMLNSNKNKSTNAIKRIVYEGKNFEGDADIAKALNMHFCSIGEKISSEIGQSPQLYSSFLKCPLEKSFFLQEIHENEVICEIQSYH